MNTDLSLYETRVIGCLIEKAITSPDQYPLSINSLTNACNQKSNRDPVLELTEQTVQKTLDDLVKKFLVSRVEGSRVTKYQHRFCNSEFGVLQLTEQATAIICELFLRGPQTPGELRSRTERLCSFKDVSQVENELVKMMERDEPLVTKLPREPGKRESRYVHLFSPYSAEATQSIIQDSVSGEPSTWQNRVELLEHQLAILQAELDTLKQQFAQLKD